MIRHHQTPAVRRSGPDERGQKMSFKGIVAAVVASVCLASVAAASTATAGRPPSFAAGPAFGFVPSRNVNHQKSRGHLLPLAWHGGPVMHATTAVPVFWGSSWNSSTFVSDKISGLDKVYSGVGGTSYAHTNSEYTDGSGNVNTTSISKGRDVTDFSATPSGAPSTSQVLQEVA